MQAIEFETDILGNTVQIPLHLVSKIAPHKHVKIILLVPEEVKKVDKIDLKNEILKIGKRCSSLPLLDKRTSNDILGYDDNGLLT